jgi:ABC-type Mn2+/Zn2+ transport system permease subunit
MTSPHELLHLLEHPQPDVDAPRNPVLTAQVMARVADQQLSARITKPVNSQIIPWIIIAAFMLVGIAVMPNMDMAGINDVTTDGGLSGAVAFFDPDDLIEIVIGAIIASITLVITWRRLI